MKDPQEFKLPDELKYSREHLWISASMPYRVGISDFAGYRMRGLSFVELPASGQTLSVGEVCGGLESRKRASQLHCPVAGEIVKVNQDLADQPRLVKDDPYGRGWIFEIEPADKRQLDELMDASSYRRYLETLV